MAVTTRFAPLAAFAATALLLSACSNDPDPQAGVGGSSAVEPTPTTSETDDAPAATPTERVPEDGAASDGSGSDDAATSTVYGTAVVDGVEYELHELRRCEPTDVDQVERELELTARGRMPAGEGYDGGDWVQIDVYVQDIGGADFDAVSWAGPEGVFGTNDAANVSYSGDRVTGTAVLVDSLTQEQTISVTYDVEVPEELLDCRP